MLHTGLGPDDAASGYMARVIAVAVQEGGMPIPRGGGIRLVEALAQLIEEAGGTLETGRDVDAAWSARPGERRAHERRRARPREPCRDLQRHADPALRPALLEADRPGARPRARFRYGRCDMQIHYALSEPPRWEGDERLGGTALVHLTPGLDGVSRAVNEATRGLLPAEATIVVGQPLTMDASRAPEGAGLLWIQLQELPWHVKGDAAGELEGAARGTTCASATPTGSRRGSRATSRTSSRRSASASCSRRPTCRRRT